MRVVMRCDGSAAIGMGHVSRSLALAQALRDVGGQVVFVSRPLGAHTSALISAQGFAAQNLDSDPAGNDGALSDNDALQTAGIARQSGASLVIVDHYGAGAEYLATLRGAHAGSIGLIDDVGGRCAESLDWILNPSIDAGAHMYTGSDSLRMLVGPQYALLRPAFAARRARLERTFNADDAGVLVTLGGGDTAALTAEVISACANMQRRVQFRCIAPEAGAVSGAHAVTYETNVVDIEEAMAWADLAINGGGTTCWELATLGVPMIIFTLADNQAYNARTLDAAGCALALGAPSAATLAQLPAALDSILGDAARRAAMSAIGSGLVDGRGAARAAQDVLHMRSAA